VIIQLNFVNLQNLPKQQSVINLAKIYCPLSLKSYINPHWTKLSTQTAKVFLITQFSPIMAQVGMGLYRVVLSLFLKIRNFQFTTKERTG